MKKGYLIDPKNQSMREVDVKDYTDIQKLLDCRVFTSADYMLHRVGAKDCLYIDDEGLLYDDTDEDRNFGFAFGICDPVFGKGLIMGLDYDNGETTERPHIPMEKYVDSICYGWSAKKPEPKIEVQSFDNFEDLIK
jgi:hypothetical protein